MSAAGQVGTVELAGIVAAWSEVPRCEVRAGGVRCGDEAEFYVTIHECGRGLVCLPHLGKFLSQAAVGERGQCNWCGRLFDDIGDAVTVVSL